MKAKIGLVGLAVMGQNLVLNINDRGFSVAVHNRSPKPIQDFLAAVNAEGRGPGTSKNPIVGAETVEAFVALLEKPRKIILLVKAGAAVDETIAKLLPHLE